MGRTAAAKAQVTLTIKGERYIAIPEADYTRLTGGDEDELAGSVEAGPFMANAIGDSLRAGFGMLGIIQPEAKVVTLR